MRGRVGDVLAWGRECPHPPLGNEDGYLDYGLLDTPFPFSLSIPQARTEDALQAAAEKAGAVLLFGTEMTGLSQDDDGVDVELTGPEGPATVRARYVVGCDGVNSTVRDALGVEFDGWNYDQSLMMADARLSSPPGAYRVRADHPARHGGPVPVPRRHVPGHRAGPGEVHRPRRRAAHAGGPERELRRHPGRGHRHAQPAVAVPVPQLAAAREDLPGRPGTARGDAAHTHIPSGGQGLQTGIQDAFNLGWKLRAALDGWAPRGLLDSYEAERYPIAAETLRKTDLSFRFETSDSLPARVLRKAAMWSMRIRPVHRLNVLHLSGLTLRYPADKRDRWTGRRVPDRPLVAAPRRPGAAVRVVPERPFRADRYGRLSARRRGLGGTAAYGCARRTPRHGVARACADPAGRVRGLGGRRTRPGLTRALRRWCGEPRTVAY